MRNAIDSAGRLVIPKAPRDAVGIVPCGTLEALRAVVAERLLHARVVAP